MFKLDFLLPACYALYTSIMMIKNASLDLGLNTLTLFIHLLNLFIIVILSIVGEKIDKWLKR